MLASWEELAGALRWGAAAGSVPEPRQWWWELRLHPSFGTVEVRVPDTQSTVGETAAVGAVVHALVHALAARHDAGEPLAAAPTWRIEENRWTACRHGLDGELADLETGERRPARARIGGLLDDLAPHATAVGCEAELEAARELVRANGAVRQRRLAAEAGMAGLTTWLADAFVPGTVSPARRRG